MSEERAVWGSEQAESYGRWARVGSRVFYGPFARQTAGRLPPLARGTTVVELGTGPGLLAVELCRLMPQAQVIGVDPSAEMLDVARRNADEAGVSNFETRLGRAEQLPMRSGSVGVVVSQTSLHEWDNPKEGLSEVLRILEPGGSLVLKDFNRTWLSQWKSVLFRPFHHLDMFKYSFHDVADLLREVGFAEVSGEEGGLQFLVQGTKSPVRETGPDGPN